MTRAFSDDLVPVSPAAIEHAMAIVPMFNRKSGWRIHGKTGSG